jgi:hypothetical protein
MNPPGLQFTRQGIRHLVRVAASEVLGLDRVDSLLKPLAGLCCDLSLELKPLAGLCCDLSLELAKAVVVAHASDPTARHPACLLPVLHPPDASGLTA